MNHLSAKTMHIEVYAAWGALRANALREASELALKHNMPVHLKWRQPGDLKVFVVTPKTEIVEMEQDGEE